MSSSTNTNPSSSSPAPQQQKQDAAAAEDTVTKKTVQTVEVRSSAGQPDGEGVLKPVRVVHEIPAKDKDPAGRHQAS